MAISQQTDELPDEEEEWVPSDSPATSELPDQDNDDDEVGEAFPSQSWLQAHRFSDLCRMARAKNVHWKSIGSTPAGRDCDILVIDGRELHNVSPSLHLGAGGGPGEAAWARPATASR